MIKFKTFIAEAALRQGISHVADLKHEHVGKLLGVGTKHEGTLHGTSTEKTDAMAFEVGHDSQGFYTRTSHSEKMRNAGDYGKAARAKFGPDHNPAISAHFDKIHRTFQANKALTSHLQKHAEQQGGESSIKGEMFHLPQATHKDAKSGHVTFVGTAYDPKHMGSQGMFVAHSKMNPNHNVGELTKLGDSSIKIHHDIPEGGGKVKVDVSDEAKKFKQINPAVLASRKHADAPEKAKHQAMLSDIKTSIDSKLRKHFAGVAPKWGNETEGHVVHPTDANPEAPRVKVVDPNFRQRKQERGPKFQ